MKVVAIWLVGMEGLSITVILTTIMRKLKSNERKNSLIVLMNKY